MSFCEKVHTNAEPMKVKVLNIPGPRVTAAVSCLMWVLGTELESCARAL